MSKGFVIVAQNTEQKDYVRMATALAMSIKASQRHNKVTLITNNEVPDKDVFDSIVDIPWGDLAWKNTRNKIENVWKAIHATPYDDTILLDADLLFPKDADTDSLWAFYAQYDAAFCTCPMTYAGTKVNDYDDRKRFHDNDLANVYSGVIYFKKNGNTYNLFTRLGEINEFWQEWYRHFLPVKDRPTRQDFDTSLNLALSTCDGNFKFMTDPTTQFVDMNPLRMPQAGVKSELWQLYWPSTFTDNGQLFVNGFRICLPFHYHTDTWLTDELLGIIRTWYASATV